MEVAEVMKEYHKIQTVFLRDPATNHKTLLEGQYALPEFEYLANNQWVFTEKVDGTNIRVMFDDRVTFGGKTDNASIPAKLLPRLQELFTPERMTSVFTSSHGQVCLYGEGYGAGIQNGGVYRPDQDFVLFDVNVSGWWLKREDVEDVAFKLGLDIVPTVGEGNLADMVSLVRNQIFWSRWNNAAPEGLVARPKIELFTRSGDRVITKLKFKDFRP